jgi:enoyl-CoA hydratase
MIEIDEREGIGVLRMCDGKANAMSIEFCELFIERLEELQASPVTAIVITGSARIFSAGVDLLRLLDGGAPYIRDLLPKLNRMLAGVFSCPKPVVAAINGHAIAGGCVLACAADRRLMGREAGRIGVTELLVGVPFPSAALEIMHCATSPQHFADVIFSGSTYAPAQAIERGLIHEIAESGTLLGDAINRAQTLAALPPNAFALTKRQIRQAYLDQINLDASRADVERIWTAPGTLARIRDYVGRTLRKAV